MPSVTAIEQCLFDAVQGKAHVTIGQLSVMMNGTQEGHIEDVDPPDEAVTDMRIGIVREDREPEPDQPPQLEPGPENK